MDEPENTQPPSEWLEALASSDADLAAGHTVTWAEARARLRATQAEFESVPVQNRA